MNNNSRKSFTLIELLVVLALVAILSVVVILTLNPAELIKQARDSNRLSDLSTINTALNLFSADVTAGFMGTSTVVYISIPDNASSTCGSLGLPALPAGYSYNCVTTSNLRNTNGTGWIPVNFQRISSNSPISQLPIDPINTTSSGNYYAYVSGGSWKLQSQLESVKYQSSAQSDGGVAIGKFEIGNNMTLAPFLDGLVGWWKFDGDALDSSVFGNNGTINSSTFTVGKIGQSSSFSGNSQYITFSPPSVTSYSACFWAKRADDLNIKNILQIGGAPTWLPLHVDTCNTGSGCVRSYLGGGNCMSGEIAGVFPTSAWTNICVVINSSVSGQMYVNATPVGPQGTSNCYNYGTDLSYAGFTGTDGINGQIDDLRIYNRVLSASEIGALYNEAR